MGAGRELHACHRQEWVGNDKSAYTIARRILWDYHPGEPEMTLLMCGAQLPQFFMGGTMLPIVAPLPDISEPPDFVPLSTTTIFANLCLHDHSALHCRGLCPACALW
jgi:hypothetical protein